MPGCTQTGPSTVRPPSLTSTTSQFFTPKLARGLAADQHGVVPGHLGDRIGQFLQPAVVVVTAVVHAVVAMENDFEACPLPAPAASPPATRLCNRAPDSSVTLDRLRRRARRENRRAGTASTPPRRRRSRPRERLADDLVRAGSAPARRAAPALPARSTRQTAARSAAESAPACRRSCARRPTIPGNAPAGNASRSAAHVSSS